MSLNRNNGASLSSVEAGLSKEQDSKNNGAETERGECKVNSTANAAKKEHQTD